MSTSRRPRWILLAAVAAVMALTVLVLTGVIDPRAVADPARVSSAVEAAGAAGPLLFVLIAVAMHFAQVGGFATLAAVAIWPVPVAALICYVSALVSSVVVFALVRRVGQGWAQKRVPPRLRALTERLEARPARTVALVRIPVYVNFGVDCVLALSSIRFRTLVVFTAVGLVPSTIWNVLANTALLSVAGSVPPGVWGAIAGAALVAVVLWWAVRRRRRAGAEVASANSVRREAEPSG